MKPDKKQLKKQIEQLTEILDKAEYELAFEDGLIYELQIRLTVFDIAMERTIAGGFDPLPEYHRKAMVEYWYDLSQNLRTAMDILDMAKSTAKGFGYDIEQKGLFRNWCSLKATLEQWKKQKGG